MAVNSATQAAENSITEKRVAPRIPDRALRLEPERKPDCRASWHIARDAIPALQRFDGAERSRRMVQSFAAESRQECNSVEGRKKCLTPADDRKSEIKKTAEATRQPETRRTSC